MGCDTLKYTTGTTIIYSHFLDQYFQLKENAVFWLFFRFNVITIQVMGGVMKKAFYCTILVVLVIMTALLSTAYGDVKPIQLSVWDTVQLYDASTQIHGLRLSIYGVNEQVHGVDWGIVPKVTGDFLGWQCGVINIVGGNATCYQGGIVNLVEGDFLGWQSGAVNVNKSLTVGLQTALFNKTESMRGVQFGVINITETLYGLQLGIINLNNSGNPFKFLPIVNFSF